MDAALRQLRAGGFDMHQEVWPGCRRSPIGTSTCLAAMA
jgi:hypothetical protein